MRHIPPQPVPESGSYGRLSPLMLGDRLIALAKEADRAGLPAIADQLLQLACDVLETGGTKAGR